LEGQHKSVLVLAGTKQGTAEYRVGYHIADRGALGRTHLLDLLRVIAAVEFDVLPGNYRVGRDDLHGFVELVAEVCRQVRMPAHHRLHRVTELARIQRPGQGDVELHRVELTQVAVVVGGTGVEEQALLQRSQRQHVSDSVLLAQLVDLVLAEPGRGEIRRSQSAATTAHMRADSGQRLEPQPAESLDL